MGRQLTWTELAELIRRLPEDEQQSVAVVVVRGGIGYMADLCLERTTGGPRLVQRPRKD